MMKRSIIYLFCFLTILIIGNACSEATTNKEASTTEIENSVDSVALRRQAEDARLYARRGYSDSINQGIIAVDTFKSSPVREVENKIGNTSIKIRYGSPGVRGRIIWGGLVAYNELWVSGAHLATAITFDKPVSIENKEVPAGTYAFFSIPGEKEWTLVLNTRWNQHLADDYNEKEDVIRVAVKPILQNVSTQRLTYTIQPVTEKSGKISLTWEKITVELPFNIVG